MQIKKTNMNQDKLKLTEKDQVTLVYKSLKKYFSNEGTSTYFIRKWIEKSKKLER